MRFVLQSFNVLELVQMENLFSTPLSSERSLHSLQYVTVQSLQARFIFYATDRECKCNVTLRSFRVTTVAMEKQ